MSFLRTWLQGAGLLMLGACLSWSPAQAQEVRPAADTDSGVHRMELYNGPLRTVHYFSLGMSPGEQSSLHALERAENEVAAADQVLALRRQYVMNERRLESRRAEVQRLLYGYNSVQPNNVLPFLGYSSNASTALGPFGPGGEALPVGFGYPGYPYPATGGGLGSSSQTLAFGMGDEGRIKTDVARTLSTLATPEHAAQASRNLDTALARVNESERCARLSVGATRASWPRVRSMRW